MKYRARQGRRKVGGNAEESIRESRMDRLIDLLSILKNGRLFCTTNSSRLKSRDIFFIAIAIDATHYELHTLYFPYCQRIDCPSCLKMSTWIGGGSYTEDVLTTKNGREKRPPEKAIVPARMPRSLPDCAQSFIRRRGIMRRYK